MTEVDILDIIAPQHKRLRAEKKLREATASGEIIEPVSYKNDDEEGNVQERVRE
jgi:hypothetical protein